ncbi:MAG: amino acid permease [Bdellovibrionales bacterium]|nr:amino acid permease [Bdellovibrionales bacterium]
MSRTKKLGLQACCAMAIGGMIGGGIFSTLGVVIEIAGTYAWLSFVFAGLIALLSGYSYCQLALRYHEGGGAFTYLWEEKHHTAAGNLAWVLILGYVVTNAVYAFTFGEYVGYLLDLGPWFPRVSSIALLLLFVPLNLRGAADSSIVEIILVWFKLVVLTLVAAYGLLTWSPEMLAQGAGASSPLGALYGAATIFMAYEGFQLLLYDYDDIEDVERTLPRAVLASVIVVVAVYVLVSIGTTSLVGAERIIQQKEVAIALAGEAAFGTFGLVLVTIAAAFSTGSAVNSTLFATARLGKIVSNHKQLPRFFSHTNSHDVPDHAVIALGMSAALLSAIGSFSSLVEAASLAFLVTFTVVNSVAFLEHAGHRTLTGCGVICGIGAVGALCWRLAHTAPASLVVLAGTALVVFVGRPLVLNALSRAR